MNSNQPILYWDPPSYESTQVATEEVVEEGQDNGSSISNTMATPGLIPVNDDFTTIPKSFGGAGASTARSKSLMNFTPPPDELQGSEIRIRKARQARKAMAQQGGDN